MYRNFHDAEMFELGIVLHSAFNDPKQLKKLEPKRLQVDDLDVDAIPAMLRIPKKKQEAD